MSIEIYSYQPIKVLKNDFISSMFTMPIEAYTNIYTHIFLCLFLHTGMHANMHANRC